MTIAQDLQKDAIASPLVELYTVDMNPIGVATVFFLTPNTKNGAAIAFGGQTYDPFPIQGSGWEVSIDGKQPQPILSVANATQFLNSYIAANQDLVGAKVTRTLTLQKYLDGEPSADSSQAFGVQSYLIYQMMTQAKNVIEFKLASLIDRPGRKFPQGQVLRAEFPGAGLIRR